jgi:SPP1 gp7 family putative phage head morphogenesis protein
MKSLWIAMSKAYWKAGIESGNTQIRDAMEYKRTFAEMPIVPDDYAAFQGDFWWKKFDGGMMKTMTDTFTAGFEAGKSMSEMQSDFMEAMSKYGPSDFTDKLGRNRPDWSEFNRIYRNASSKCWNTARLEIGKKSSIVVGMVYIAVLDDRTRTTHRALDGMKWPLSDPRISLYNPPSDHNCRCMMDYVYEWEVTTWDSFPTWTPAEGFGG